MIDAPLPKPAKGWCRGPYGVTLQAVVTFNCAIDPPRECGSRRAWTEDVAQASRSEAGSDPTTICHAARRGSTVLDGGDHRDPVFWSVSATLDDLLGPDGATTDADPYFERAFRNHPLMNRHWEIDDN